jgi:tRNA(His) 5'-end guanylyltransferase
MSATKTTPTTPDGNTRYDELGDRMKRYESAEAGRRLMPMLPIIARIDGRSFHTFTKGLQRPFDDGFVECMRATAKALLKETAARIAYVQSDEISLVWHSETYNSQIWFDGRIAKMQSNLAATATVHFYKEVLQRLPQKAPAFPTFDARVWQVPNREEAANALLWREIDAYRNSVQMLGHAHFSNKALHGVPTSGVKKMLEENGTPWEALPVRYKRGSWFQKRSVIGALQPGELEELPAHHHARTDPNFSFKRYRLVEVENMPRFSTVTNRVDVIFESADPVTAGADA